MTKQAFKSKAFFYDSGSDAVVILIHGFAGAPEDLVDLGKFLHASGLSVKAPILAGHGSNWQALETVRPQDWCLTVNREILWAEKHFKKIFLVGYSLGGILALDSAANHVSSKIQGVVSFSSPVFLRGELFMKMLLPIWHFLFKKYRKGYIAKEFMDAYQETGHYAYVPTKSIRDFFDYLKYARKFFSQVTLPTMVIQSQEDSIVHHLSSDYIFNHLGSERKELIILDNTAHNQLLASKQRNQLFGQIVNFINSLL